MLFKFLIRRFHWMLQSFCIWRFSNGPRMRPSGFYSKFRFSDIHCSVWYGSHFVSSIQIYCWRIVFLLWQARSELKRSEVADNDSGKSKLSTVRTSSGMFISKNKVRLNLHTNNLLSFLDVFSNFSFDFCFWSESRFCY